MPFSWPCFKLNRTQGRQKVFVLKSFFLKEWAQDTGKCSYYILVTIKMNKKQGVRNYHTVK